MNCTFAGTANQHAVVIRNVGDAGLNIPSLVARHRGVAVFDFTGTSAVELYDVVIGTDAVIYPQTGVLWARNSHGGSLFHKMQNCHILGKYSVAPFYNYGAENDTLIDCYLANFATTPNTKVAVWTANNISGLRSVVDGLMATGPQSCIDHNCFGNQYYNEGGAATSDCVYLEDADSWKNFGGWACSASQTSDGGALIHVDMSHGASNFSNSPGLDGRSLRAPAIVRYPLQRPSGHADRMESRQAAGCPMRFGRSMRACAPPSIRSTSPTCPNKHLMVWKLPAPCRIQRCTRAQWPCA